MNVFLVLAHPEPKSFNRALFREAHRLFEAQGHAVRASDLYAMGFNPLSARHNFISVKDPEFLKLQVEETHATEVFADEVKRQRRGLAAVYDSIGKSTFEQPLTCLKARGTLVLYGSASGDVPPFGSDEARVSWFVVRHAPNFEGLHADAGRIVRPSGGGLPGGRVWRAKASD